MTADHQGHDPRSMPARCEAPAMPPDPRPVGTPGAAAGRPAGRTSRPAVPASGRRSHHERSERSHRQASRSPREPGRRIQPKGARDKEPPAPRPAQSCGCSVVRLYNEVHPRSRLGRRSPREYIRDTGPTRRVSGLTGATPQAFLTATAINLKRLAAALFATLLTCRLFMQPLAVPRRRVPIRRPRQVANISNRGRPLQPLHPSEASATAPGCIGCATRSRMCRRASTRWSRPRSARPSCKPTGGARQTWRR